MRRRTSLILRAVGEGKGGERWPQNDEFEESSPPQLQRNQSYSQFETNKGELMERK
jgi:hypothetical protein